MQQHSLQLSKAVFAARVSVVTFCFFIAAVIALNLLRSDLNLLRHPMSNYARGPYGWLMATAFIVFGVGVLSLSVGLGLAGPKSISAKIGLGMLALCGLGTIVAGFFPADLPGETTTFTGQVHIIDAIVNFVSVTVASLLLSISFWRDERWHSYGVKSLLLAGSSLFAFVYMWACPITIFGLANKLFVIALISWLLVTTVRLQNEAREMSRSLSASKA